MGFPSESNVCIVNPVFFRLSYGFLKEFTLKRSKVPDGWESIFERSSSLVLEE